MLPLDIDPKRVNAWVQKGYAVFSLAEDSKDPDKAYAAARKPSLALNKLEPDHPVPLICFDRSFVVMGQPPTKNATDGLEWAAELAPFDLHSGESAESDREVLASLDGKPDEPVAGSGSPAW